MLISRKWQGSFAQAIDHKTSGGRITEQTGNRSIWNWTKYNLLNEPRKPGHWFTWYASFFFKYVISMAFQDYIGNYYHAYIWSTMFTIFVLYRMVVSQISKSGFYYLHSNVFEHMGITKIMCDLSSYSWLNLWPGHCLRSCKPTTDHLSGFITSVFHVVPRYSFATSVEPRTFGLHITC